MERTWQLALSYIGRWKIKHKLMHAMQGQDSQYLLKGMIQVDDPYFGGELSGGKVGRGSKPRFHLSLL